MIFNKHLTPYSSRYWPNYKVSIIFHVIFQIIMLIYDKWLFQMLRLASDPQYFARCFKELKFYQYGWMKNENLHKLIHWQRPAGPSNQRDFNLTNFWPCDTSTPCSIKTKSIESHSIDKTTETLYSYSLNVKLRIIEFCCETRWCEYICFEQ